MKEFIHLLKKTRLFFGVGEEEIALMLGCLNGTARSYVKGEYVLRQGERGRGLALLARGGLHIRKEDYWGNLSILSEIRPGEIFGEAYVAPDSGTFMNDVTASEDSVVLFFDMDKVLSVCPSACPFHTQLIKNLFYTISERNRGLVRKLGYMSRRTTREKLLSYLSDEAERQNSSTFTIPFNRQQLADFLSVDRSAMSNELCKMRDQGILAFHKSEFTICEAKMMDASSGESGDY